jgi:hypothetical protein
MPTCFARRSNLWRRSRRSWHSESGHRRKGRSMMDRLTRSVKNLPFRLHCAIAGLPNLKQRGSLIAATETLGKFDLAASVSATLCTAEDRKQRRRWPAMPQDRAFHSKVAVK